MIRAFHISEGSSVACCRYRRFITAEVSLEKLKRSEHAVGGGPGIVEETERAQLQKAEALVERYLATGNERNEYFEKTTPLFSSRDGILSLMVPGYEVGRHCFLICQDSATPSLMNDLKQYTKSFGWTSIQS